MRPPSTRLPIASRLAITLGLGAVAAVAVAARPSQTTTQTTPAAPQPAQQAAQPVKAPVAAPAATAAAPADRHATAALLAGDGTAAAGLLKGPHIEGRQAATTAANQAALRGGDNPLAHQLLEGFIEASRGRCRAQLLRIRPQGGPDRRGRGAGEGRRQGRWRGG